MQEKQVLERAFAMPLTSPAYPPGPYRFVNREYLIITYRTDPARLRAVVPEPLELDQREALVKYEFIRMPDSNGFGDYTESGQVIPVSFRGRKGSYTHCMFLNDEGPIAGGRELWGFPKKLAQPTLRTEIDTLVGTLDYGPLRIATGTMGYKHREADLAHVKSSLEAPNFLLKDHSARRRQLPDLRARRISPGGCHDKGRVDRARGAPPVTPRFGTRRRIAGAQDRVRNSYPKRSYTRPR
jgi:acetoacetate decarboxylase